MKRLDYISNLRFPLIAGVVFDHASYFMPASVRSEGVASMVFCMFQTVLKISVPVFFIISGFLFFGECITQNFGWSILLIAAIAIVCSVQGNLILTRFSHIILAGCCIFYSCFVSDRYHFKVPTVLTDSVFFVYASHTIFILLASNHIFTVFIPDTSHPEFLILRLFMVSMLVLVTCISLFVSLRHFFPKTISVLTGSR